MTQLAVRFDESAIDAIFTGLDQCHLPGAAVGISIAGRPVYRKGFGLASMELPAVLSPAIRMRLGSTSKMFTALAYMLLCEQGKARLDDPVGDHLPELHAVARPVTMRQLMGHTGGLRDATEIVWLFGGLGRPIATDAIVHLYREIEDANARPGEAWIYNNGAYALLCAAIERIASMPLEDVLRTLIFRPSGMEDTMLRRFDTDFVPNSAMLHMTAPGGGYDKACLGTSSAGQGGIVSTVDDMLRWLAHMDKPVVGSASTWTAMRSSQRLANGAPTGYGLGLMSGRYRGVEIVHHPGGVMGGSAQVVKAPAEGLDIVVLVNRHDVLAPDLANRILDACLPQLEPAAGSSGSVLSSGVFRSPETGRVIQLYASGGQQLVSIDGTDLAVCREACGTLVPVATKSYVKQSFELRGAPDRPASIRFTDFGHVDELLPAEVPGPDDLRSCAGCYSYEAARLEATIFEDEGRLEATSRFGSATYKLEPLAKDAWKVRSLRHCVGLLQFAAGRAMELSSARMRRLVLRKCN